MIIRVISRALKELCAQFTSGEKYCQIELVWNWDLKKGRWGSCIANLEELIHRGIVHCSSGWGGQDRDHNIPVQILKIDNTMTLSLSLVSVNSELLSLTWNMGFFVCDLSYCKKVVEDSSVGRAERRLQRRGGSTVVAAVLPEPKEVRPGCRAATARPRFASCIWCINASAS